MRRPRAAENGGLSPNPPIAVVGPTASGKSDLALDLAARFGGEIVGCDSVQVYRGFEIGSAKTPPNERRGIPHHLIDIADPAEVFSAGDYARLARQAIDEIEARGRTPIVAGGTGFYLRALFEGLFAGPVRDEALRARLERREDEGPQGRLHRLLRRLDPASAARIHPRDRPKLVRALEVRLLAGRPVAEAWRDGQPTAAASRPLVLFLDPPREALYARIERRARAMFEGGLVEEVRRLLAFRARPGPSARWGTARRWPSPKGG